MIINDAISMEYNQFNTIIREFISEIYLIHSSGVVKYAKSFDEFKHFDPQLVGSFISALESFVEITSIKLNDNKIELQDIGTSSARWFLKKSKDFILAMMIPNSSTLAVDHEYSIIYDIISDILMTFLHYHEDKLERFDFVVSEDFEHDLNSIIIEKIQSFGL
jgi:hypothetical protein